MNPAVQGFNIPEYKPTNHIDTGIILRNRNQKPLDKNLTIFLDKYEHIIYINLGNSPSFISFTEIAYVFGKDPNYGVLIVSE